MTFSKLNTTKELEVTVVRKKSQVTEEKTISLSKRIKKAKLISNTPEMEFSGPEEELVITWDEFFMSLALLSRKKQGRYERHSNRTVSYYLH